MAGKNLYSMVESLSANVPVQECLLRFSFPEELTSWSTEDTADDENISTTAHVQGTLLTVRF